MKRLSIPVSILYKSIADRYRPVRVADGPITARYRFLKNASWDGGLKLEAIKTTNRITIDLTTEITASV